MKRKLLTAAVTMLVVGAPCGWVTWQHDDDVRATAHVATQAASQGAAWVATAPGRAAEDNTTVAAALSTLAAGEGVQVGEVLVARPAGDSRSVTTRWQVAFASPSDTSADQVAAAAGRIGVALAAQRTIDVTEVRTTGEGAQLSFDVRSIADTTQ